MEQQIVFFDDTCVLCSRSVRFIYRHDPRGRFRFASFDSEAFREIAGLLPETMEIGGSVGSQASPGTAEIEVSGGSLGSSDTGETQDNGGSQASPRTKEVQDNGGSQASAGSVVLYGRGKVYLRSAAALRIAMSLRFPMPLLVAGFLLPPFIRDGIYDWIARNRYRWFGKRERCFLPDGELRKRFLD